MTKEQYFLSKAYLVNDKIKICGMYYNSYTKIDVKCKRCGYEWKMLPSNVLNDKIKRKHVNLKNINYL